MKAASVNRALAGATLAAGTIALGGWLVAAQAQVIPTPAAALPMPSASALAAADPQVTRGEYLARAGDCISCHTRPQGIPFAGGLPMKTPFGTIVSTNITPDREQGIGSYTLEDFTRALREGKARDGRHLYPAMPYTNFSRLADADLQSLYAYFMKAVPAAKQENAQTDLPWPFSMRWLMGGWNLLYLPGKPYEPVAEQSAEWNRGAYLVQGLGHCSACHTPRRVTGAEKASSEKAGEAFLSGALIEGWYAQPLRNTVNPGLGTWRVDDIAEYLKSGRNNHTAAFGLMAEVVGNSTSHLSREDLTAIGTYLKSLSADGEGAVGAGRTAVAAPANPAGDPTALALREGQVARAGAMVFVNNCAGCHKSDGLGVRRTFPALGGNTAVAAADPTSLIRIVLAGSAMPRTTEAPSALAMPGFGWRLTDANVADLLTFVRSSWGNRAAAVTPQEVAKVRKETAASAAR